ncbi:MAG: Gfo/Idh/MocA family oxidoreductase, partial [Gemmatimonadetes bacterium]|nr:Gfo/Idh/MocA family oxidoreductase [Gemmatimonadota bacterium]
MDADAIRIGLVGAGGNMRRKHIPGFRAIEGVELACVANRTLESGRRVAAEFDIPDVRSNWLEVVEDDSLDAVCIGTWPYMHAPITIAALGAGKHLLVEARMAMDSGEARAMLAASRDSPHLVAQVVPSPLTLSVDRTVIDMISEGFVGEPVLVDMRIATGSFPEWDSGLGWRHEREFSGNNVMSMGIWYEGLMRWLGPMAAVQARAQTVVKHRRDASGRRRAITIPDHVEIVGDMACGGMAHLSFSAVAGFAPGNDVWIHGTEGALRLRFGGGDPPHAELEAGRRGDDRMAPVDIPAGKRGAWRVEREFVNAIR